MRKRLTLIQKINKRKAKKPCGLIYFLLVHTILAYYVRKFNVHLKVKDDINKIKGPKFLIFNHQSRLDYIWAVKLAYPTKLNYVVGYNEFFRKKFYLVFKFLHVIPKKNFTSDIGSVRKINEIINKGGTVCFSPEGMSSINGHNQPVVVGTGKFLKHYKVPIYAIKSQGGFLSAHKVCLDERPGKVEAEIFCLFTPKELEVLTEQEIEDKINEALWVDDYEWNKEHRIKFDTHGNVTSHYEDLMYRCPKCGKEFSMFTHENVIECKECGNGIVVDDYYDLHPLHEGDIVPDSPSRWVDEERREEYLKIKNDPNYSFKCKAKLKELPKYVPIKTNETGILCGEGEVVIDHNGLFFKGNRNGEAFEFMLNYKQFWTLVIVTDCTFTALYVNGEYLEIHPEGPYIGKMLLMVEEFSRFHYNVWPNFKWMQWIYS